MAAKIKQALATVAVWVGLMVFVYLFLTYEAFGVILGVLVGLGVLLLGSPALKSGMLTFVGVLVLALVLMWLFGL